MPLKHGRKMNLIEKWAEAF